MDTLIKQEMKDELTETEIMRICENKVKIIVYETLGTYSSIDDLFYPHDAVVILYQNTAINGHWVCLIRNSGQIEYFDPYGKKYDYFLINGYVANKTPYLTTLLNGQNVVYNAEPLQKKQSGIQTCGRWCSVRIKMRDIKLNRFLQLFKDKNKRDYMVTAMTFIFTL